MDNATTSSCSLPLQCWSAPPMPEALASLQLAFSKHSKRSFRLGISHSDCVGVYTAFLWRPFGIATVASKAQEKESGGTIPIHKRLTRAQCITCTDHLYRSNARLHHACVLTQRSVARKIQHLYFRKQSVRFRTTLGTLRLRAGAFRRVHCARQQLSLWV